MRLQRLCLRVVLLLLSLAGSAAAREGARHFIVTGQVVIPPPYIAEPFEILLFQQGGRPVDQVRSSEGRFRFEGLSEATYFIVVNLPGFDPVRQRVTTGGPLEEIVANIVLSPREKTVVVESVDLSGELDNVVDVVDLQRRGSDKLLDQLARANQELKDGKPVDATHRLEAVIKKAPDLYEARKSLGAAYQHLGRYREAETEFTAARRLRPESAAPLLNLGSLYLQEADASTTGGPADVGQLLRQAFENLQAAVAINPAAAFGHYLLGIALYKSNSYQDAEDKLKHALALEPRLGHARLALANLYIRSQQWGKALSQIDAYLKEQPNAPDRDEVTALRSRIESLLARPAG
jgi:Tfp pilus assembly protein PilF